MLVIPIHSYRPPGRVHQFRRADTTEIGNIPPFEEILRQNCHLANIEFSRLNLNSPLHEPRKSTKAAVETIADKIIDANINGVLAAFDGMQGVRKGSLLDRIFRFLKGEGYFVHFLRFGAFLVSEDRINAIEKLLTEEGDLTDTERQSLSPDEIKTIKRQGADFSHRVEAELWDLNKASNTLKDTHHFFQVCSDPSYLGTLKVNIEYPNKHGRLVSRHIRKNDIVLADWKYCNLYPSLFHVHCRVYDTRENEFVRYTASEYRKRPESIVRKIKMFPILEGCFNDYARETERFIDIRIDKSQKPWVIY